MKRLLSCNMAVVALGWVLLAGCTGNVRPSVPSEDRAAALEQSRDEVRDMARGTLEDLYVRQPEARGFVESAAGYAVFSNFGMKILVAGGGKGGGIAVERVTQREVFMRMAEIQAGLGFGIKKFRVIWVFQTSDAFRTFVDSGYELGSQATLSARSGSTGAGIAGAVTVSPGVWVYQLTDDGIAAELTVKGTRYYRDSALD